MGKIKNILFDFGGVIITLDQPQAVRHFKEIGLADAEQRLDPYRQSGIFGDLEVGKINAEQFRSELSRMIGREVTYDDCMYAWKGYVGELPKRNLDILGKLRAEGYRLILLSNTNPYMMGWAMSDGFDGEGHSLEHYFDAVYMSYKCGVMKPDERFFRHVLDSENIVPQETLFLDDGQRNVEAAERFGIRTFRPDNGADWTEEIYKYLNE